MQTRLQVSKFDGVDHNKQGVSKGKFYAHMWFKIAASYEDKISGNEGDEVAKEMTAADISKAHDLARECVKKEYKGC